MTGGLGTNKKLESNEGKVQLAGVTRKKITNKKQCTSRKLTDITDHKSRNGFVNKKFFLRAHDCWQETQ